MPTKCKSMLAAVVSLIAFQATSIIAAGPTTAGPVQQVQIVAGDMCCQGCARKVSAQLYAARGVRDVGVDLKTRTVTVSLPVSKGATLGQLWQAVERGNGGPTRLVTAEATYTLALPEQEVREALPLSVVIDNLHCQGCAKKIAAQLYTIKGVTKVGVDMKHETLIVQTQAKAPVSPWALIDAVARANERPLAVLGGHGQITIEWATKAMPKTHQQAYQPNTGGIQR